MADKYKISGPNCNCGGCISFIVFIFLMIALFWGLKTPWGEFGLDLFPPRITLPQGVIESK